MTEKHSGVVDVGVELEWPEVGSGGAQSWAELPPCVGAQQMNSPFYLYLLAFCQANYKSGSRGVGMLGLITEQNRLRLKILCESCERSFCAMFLE